MTRFIAVFAIMLGLSACGSSPGERAVTGGAIGAGAGALVGGTTGVGWLPGAVVGGVGGAVIGAATTPLAW